MADDPRLENILAAFINACEAGSPPDRQELLALHPDLAAELRQFFAGRDRMHNLAAPFRPASDFPSSPLAAGQHLSYVGNYEILEEIARGGMGVVYKARQQTLGRIVAVKMIGTGRLATAEDVKRFQFEAQAAAGLQHPNIVSIHEVGQHEGWHYFSMDFVAGRDLASLLREKVLPPRQAAKYVRQMAEAIHYAHQQGTLHRDLKPSNVLIDRHDQVRVTDFGLALRIEDNSELTRTGQVLGTPSYMPPEQAQGKRSLIGPASDVYAMGAVLYECLTGRPPFRAGSVVETIHQVIHVDAASPRLLNPGIPRDLETICLKCLEKESHKRYGTAQLLADDLGRYLDGAPISARPISRPARLGRWCRRNPVIAGLSSLAIVLLCAVTVVSAAAYHRELGLRMTVQTKSAALVMALDHEKILTAAEVRAKTDARTAEIKERQQRTVAEAAEQQANLQKTLVEQRSTELVRMLYKAQMNLAGNSTLDPRGAALVSELTTRWKPRPGDPDLRGWEWYYLDAFCNSDRLTLRGHSHHVTSVAWNPAGTRLASGSTDHTVRISDASAGTNLFVLRGHQDGVTSISWNPRANQIASASVDNTIKIWDTETGKEIRSLTGHTNSVSSVAWSSDGERLVSAGADQQLKIWNPATGQELMTWTGHDAAALSAAWSPDGRSIASGGLDGVVNTWDASTGLLQRTFRGEGFEILCVAWSPDGARLASAGGAQSNCRIWDVNTGQQLQQLLGHLHEIYSIDWSPDGTQVVTACRDKVVRIWDAGSGQHLTTFHGHTNGVTSARWSPSGMEIASGSQDFTVKQWDVQAGVERTIARGHAGTVLGLAWAPDGRKLATASADHSIKIWDAAGGQLMRTLDGHSREVFSVAWSPDGTRLASAGNDSVINVWNSTTGELIRSLTGLTGKVESVAWSPDSSQIAAAGHDESLRVWNATTGESVCSLPFATRKRTVAWSPDGRRLALTLEAAHVRVIDTGTWKEVLLLSDDALCVAWSPDGARLATGDALGIVKIWNSRTGAEQFVLRGHATWCNCVNWSPDGSRLASSSEDCSTKVWDTSDGSLALTLSGDGHWFFAAAWSPDGRSLATASYVITVWRTAHAYERNSALIRSR